jgi:hypothetical protein
MVLSNTAQTSREGSIDGQNLFVAAYLTRLPPSRLKGRRESPACPCSTIALFVGTTSSVGA